MSAPDPAYVRMYNARRNSAVQAAQRQVKSITEDIDAIRRDLARGQVFASQGRALADAAVRLTEHLAALETFAEFAFLTTDPDAPEVS